MSEQHLNNSLSPDNSQKKTCFILTKSSPNSDHAAIRVGATQCVSEMIKHDGGQTV